MKKPQSVSCLVRGIYYNLTHFVLFKFTLCDKCCLACKIREATAGLAKKKKRNGDILSPSHFKMYLVPYKGYIFRAQHAEIKATTGGVHSNNLPPETFPSFLLHISIQLLPFRGFIHPPSRMDRFTQSSVSSFFFLTQPCCFTPVTFLYSPVSCAFLQLLHILLCKTALPAPSPSYHLSYFNDPCGPATRHSYHTLSLLHPLLTLALLSAAFSACKEP